MSSKALFDYVRSITDDLDLPEKTKAGIREEAIAHLEDEASRWVAEGMSPGDAERAAIERFGRENEMAKMLSESLAATQARFKARRILLTAAAILVAFTVWPFVRELYCWIAMRGTLQDPRPWWVYYTGLVMLAGMFVILFAIAMRLAGARIVVAVSATVAVIALGFISWPLAAIIYTSMGGRAIIGGSVAGEMSGYCAWALAVGAVALALHRDRSQYLLAGACLINAALAGYIHFLGITHPTSYLRSPETPGAAFSGLQLVLFIWLLARAIMLLCDRRGWLRGHQYPALAK